MVIDERLEQDIKHIKKRATWGCSTHSCFRHGVRLFLRALVDGVSTANDMI